MSDFWYDLYAGTLRKAIGDSSGPYVRRILGVLRAFRAFWGDYWGYGRLRLKGFRGLRGSIPRPAACIGVYRCSLCGRVAVAGLIEVYLFWWQQLE